MPSAYSSQQKKAIIEFVSVAQTDRSSAARLLKQVNWDVSAAVNAFFNSPTTISNSTRTTLSKTFDKYREDPKEEPDLIDISGTSNLLGELDIALDDVGALIFSEIVSSPSLGKITRDGFIDGWSDLTVDTLPKMRNVVLQLRSALGSDTATMRAVYNHTFTLALAQGSKILPLETATEFWRLLFSPPSYSWRTSQSPWLDWWLEFLEEGKRTKAVNKDLWKQTLTFAYETMRDEFLKFWNEESSWPSVIDEFVEWVKTEKRAGGGSADGMEVE